MKSNSTGDKSVKRYATIFVIVVVAILAADIAWTYYYENYIVRIGISRFEKIEIKSASVIKYTYVYYVTINFTNAGASSTSIASVLLNDTPYNDSGWVGTVKPAVVGDLALKSIIDVDASNMGVIIFSDDCEYLPSGYRLMAGETVKITIYTTGDKDYGTSIMLPGSASTNNLEVNPLGTALTLSIPSTAMQYIPVTLKATLKDGDGNPIQDAMIHFGPFRGDGIFAFNSALTGADGTASVTATYQLIGITQIWAIFDGNSHYAESMVMGTLTVQPIMLFIIIVIIIIVVAVVAGFITRIVIKVKDERPNI